MKIKMVLVNTVPFINCLKPAGGEGKAEHRIVATHISIVSGKKSEIYVRNSSLDLWCHKYKIS